MYVYIENMSIYKVFNLAANSPKNKNAPKCLCIFEIANSQIDECKCLHTSLYRSQIVSI